MKEFALLSPTCPLLPPFPTLAKIYGEKYIKRDPNTQGYAESNVNNWKQKF